MAKILKTKEVKGTNGCRLLVTVGDGHTIGEFLRDVDGFYYYKGKPKSGLSSSYSLRLIADLLDKVNKPWDDHINEYFKNGKSYDYKRENKQDT